MEQSEFEKLAARDAYNAQRAQAERRAEARRRLREAQDEIKKGLEELWHQLEGDK